jgi:hypothetical protein
MKSQIIRASFGLVVGAIAGWHGIDQLAQWYQTGQVTADFRSLGTPTHYQSIAFDDRPLNFVFEFSLSVLLIILGIVLLAIFIKTIHGSSNTPRD